MSGVWWVDVWLAWRNLAENSELLKCLDWWGLLFRPTGSRRTWIKPMENEEDEVQMLWIHLFYFCFSLFRLWLKNSVSLHFFFPFSIYSHLIFWPLTCWIKLWGPKHTRCILALGFGHDYFTTEEALASLLCLSSTQSFQVKFMSSPLHKFFYIHQVHGELTFHQMLLTL